MKQKKFKKCTDKQRGILVWKKKMAEMEILKYMVQLNTVLFDIANKVSEQNLEFQKTNFEKSIALEKKNIEELERILKEGFEIADQHASDQVADALDEKARKQKKKLPGSPLDKNKGVKT